MYPQPHTHSKSRVRLVPSHYLCVLGVREDWGLVWGARVGLMGRDEGKIATGRFRSLGTCKYRPINT